jgi:hypothetical protein
MSEQTEVVITLKDVYLEVQHLTKMLTPLVDPNTGVVAKQQDHESRLRKLEMKVYAIPGAMTVLSAGGLAWAVFGKQ